MNRGREKKCLSFELFYDVHKENNKKEYRRNKTLITTADEEFVFTCHGDVFVI